MGWRPPSSCSMDPGSHSSSWGSGGALLPEGDLTGECPHCVCSFPSLPNHPIAMIADRESCSGCAGVLIPRPCPVPPCLHGAGSCQESLQHPFDLQPGGVRGHEGPCRVQRDRTAARGGGLAPWDPSLGNEPRDKGLSCPVSACLGGRCKACAPPKLGHFFLSVS